MPVYMLAQENGVALLTFLGGLLSDELLFALAAPAGPRTGWRWCLARCDRW